MSEGVSETSQVLVVGQQHDYGLLLNSATTSGSRLTLTLLQMPASISRLSGDEVRTQNNATLQEAVARSPGLFRFGSPGNGGTTLAARGFVGHSSVMQLYDGTRTYVGAGTLTFPTDTWSVERVDILRGPSSVLYGEGATGAAVNVISKQPFFGESKHQFRMAGGSWRKHQAAIDSGGGLTDELAYRLTFNQLASRGWKERTTTKGVAVRGALTWQTRDNIKVTLSQDIAVQHPLNDFGTPLINGYYHKVLRKQNYNIVDDDLFYNDRTTRLQSDWQINESVLAQNQLYTISSSRHWLGAEGYTWQPDKQKLKVSAFYQIRHRYQQWGDRQTLTFQHRLMGLDSQTLVGVEFNHIRFKNQSNLPKPKGHSDYRYVDIWQPQAVSFISSTPFLGAYQTKTHIISQFAENRTELLALFSVVTGLRYDYVKMDRDNLRDGTVSGKRINGFNWRTGVVFAPTEVTSLYGQYSTSTDGIGYIISLSPTQQNYRLARANQIEIGIKQQLNRGEWTFAAYQIKKKKLLTADPINPNQKWQIGKQSSRGLEASLILNLPYDTHISTNVAYVDAKYDHFSEGMVSYDNNRPVNVPRYTANLWLTKQINAMNVGSGIRYVGSRYGDYANRHLIPHYTVIDANVTWQMDTNVKLGIEINNIFDRHYPITSHNQGQQWLIGEPRSFLFTLEAQF